ncbi:hypothetical protein [Providencia sp.]|uniref:hypothetical protein n=1 Tax=Providencia sp. TaxID=589 RepID=UPI003F95B41A
MSYIDTFRHELLGYFNGLPIYHPLDIVSAEGWREPDFSCAPDTLVLGGGSGEHPALVLHNLPSLAAGYLFLALERFEHYFPDVALNIPQEAINAMTDIYYLKADLEFCGWSMLQTHEFVNNAKSSLHCSPLEDNQSVEGWIENSIGEFIYYSIPELINTENSKLFEIFKEYEIGYWMKNVLCPPPNYMKTRKQSMKDSAFQEAGFFAWDYTKAV